jgi:hypothetical protein
VSAVPPLPGGGNPRVNSSWTLDPRAHDGINRAHGCPDGERNAEESECLAAVQQATLVRVRVRVRVS